jgi:putative nucleotidyltransferase with HDIG domain
MPVVAAEGPIGLDAVLRRIDQISTLPQVAVRVMKVANDPNSSAADLKQVMEGDVALCARVLRCVNSSAYAVRTKITNLQQAIAYLGMKQIRNLAMTASVSQLFGKEETVGTYRRSGLWKHLVAVGLCARLIAMRLKFANFEDMFLAGLLHDIGIVFEDQYARPAFAKVVASLQPGRSLSEVERHHLDFDHTALGERVARTWGFPDAMQAAIRHHHAAAAYQGEHVEVLRCVEVANVVCSLKGMSSVGVPLVKISQATIQALSLAKQDLLVLSEDLDREVGLNSNLFQL